MRIAIILFDGFDELDAIGPYEVFRHAARLGADIDVELLTLGDAEEVNASGGLRVRPHGRLEELRASGAHVVDTRVVDDGDLIMAGGVTSGIDLALWLVEREVGGQISAGVAEEMDYPRNGAIWSGRHPGGATSQYHPRSIYLRRRRRVARLSTSVVTAAMMAGTTVLPTHQRSPAPWR